MNTQTEGGHGARHDRFVQEYEHDSYKTPGKLKEPTVCKSCGALFHKGRWTWGTKPAGAHEIVCPACRRIQDNYPKGFITLNGSYLDQHRDQVMGVIHNTEAQEKKEHPLARIMTIVEQPEGLVVSTTDTHLPRRIGEALKRSHHGTLEVRYDKDEEFVRVTWTG
ncbi:MAG: BCAM0308 family protein [Nitrospira sp.]|nr:ATPase [Nitrospira sp.]